MKKNLLITTIAMLLSITSYSQDGFLAPQSFSMRIGLTGTFDALEYSPEQLLNYDRFSPSEQNQGVISEENNGKVLGKLSPTIAFEVSNERGIYAGIRASKGTRQLNETEKLQVSDLKMVGYLDLALIDLFGGQNEDFGIIGEGIDLRRLIIGGIEFGSDQSYATLAKGPTTLGYRFGSQIGWQPSDGINIHIACLAHREFRGTDQVVITGDITKVAQRYFAWQIGATFAFWKN